MKNKGLLIVLSGPSGCGKGTMVAEILKRGDCAVSVSATTRAPREGEVDHVHYHFLTRGGKIKQRIAENGLLEYATYCDNYYGTPRKEVEQMRAEGKHVILEIEVQGAFQIRERCPDAVLVFTVPPSVAELRRRLHKRGTETDEVIEKRIARAMEELPFAEQYDYVILNDALEDAVSDFNAVIRAETLRPAYTDLVSLKGREHIMMLRPSMYQIISKNESYYSLVIGVAKRAREISEQHVKEKEAAKAAAEKRAKMNGDQKVRLDDKTIKMVVLEENPVKTAVDEFAAGKFKLVKLDSDSER